MGLVGYWIVRMARILLPSDNSMRYLLLICSIPNIRLSS